MKDEAKLNLKDMLEAEQIEWADRQNGWEGHEEEDPEQREWEDEQSELAEQQRSIDREWEEDPEQREWEDEQSELAEQQRRVAKDNSHY